MDVAAFHSDLGKRNVEDHGTESVDKKLVDSHERRNVIVVQTAFSELSEGNFYRAREFANQIPRILANRVHGLLIERRFAYRLEDFPVGSQKIGPSREGSRRRSAT